MPTYADHTIEYWGNVYQACRLEKENITFASFIESPQSILEALGMDDALEIMESGFLPLLPKQARLRRKLDGLMPAAANPNGQVQPLHTKVTDQRGLTASTRIEHWGHAAA